MRFLSAALCVAVCHSVLSVSLDKGSLHDTKLQERDQREFEAVQKENAGHQEELEQFEAAQKEDVIVVSVTVTEDDDDDEDDNEDGRHVEAQRDSCEVMQTVTEAARHSEEASDWSQEEVRVQPMEDSD
ncbi:unnamed protein product [Knipowitschia caucasica]|uniref:Uncharacterized protein n=1 Tax=Knipowitschia caucasica TaxID=637954 RepID=A0AAV2IYD3_KNICA